MYVARSCVMCSAIFNRSFMCTPLYSFVHGSFTQHTQTQRATQRRRLRLRRRRFVDRVRCTLALWCEDKWIWLETICWTRGNKSFSNRSTRTETPTRECEHRCSQPHTRDMAKAGRTGPAALLCGRCGRCSFAVSSGTACERTRVWEVSIWLK